MSFRLPVSSPLGRWVVEGDDEGLIRVWFPADKRSLTHRDAPALVHSAAQQLEEYFAGERTWFDSDLHVEGTEFQIDVWEALTRINYGEVATYGDIAAAIGKPTAVRAVGNANGKNPLPVIIPCHRVLGANGLGGYSGGLEIKEFLLELEGWSLF
jgi:methylated-DNA-[protein]-cysteine S-methyltransferase